MRPPQLPTPAKKQVHCARHVLAVCQPQPDEPSLSAECINLLFLTQFVVYTGFGGRFLAIPCRRSWQRCKKLSKSSFYATFAGGYAPEPARVIRSIGRSKKFQKKWPVLAGYSGEMRRKRRFLQRLAIPVDFDHNMTLIAPVPTRAGVLFWSSAPRRQLRTPRLPARARIATFTENAPSGAFSTFVWETTCLPFL
ncbi:hypothetical protein [Achromobacter aegrifaciens]